MKNRIRTLEDLKLERQLLKLQIDATELLIKKSLHLSKEHFMGDAADMFFSLFNRESNQEDQVLQAILPNLTKTGWVQKLIPLIPLLLKMVGSFYKKRKLKRKSKLKSGEVVLA